MHTVHGDIMDNIFSFYIELLYEEFERRKYGAFMFNFSRTCFRWYPLFCCKS